MAMSRADVLARIREADYRKMVRFASASGVAFVFTQGFIVFLHVVVGMGAAASNVLAVSLATIPAYVMNRYWVWGKRDKNRFAAEVMPFWILTLVGLGLSTLFAYVGAKISDAPLVVNVANTLGFGIVWVFKFFVIDKFMFGEHQHIDHQHFPPDEELDAQLHATLEADDPSPGPEAARAGG